MDCRERHQISLKGIQILPGARGKIMLSRPKRRWTWEILWRYD